MRSRTGSSIFPDVLPSYTEEPPTENRVGRSPSIVFESIFNIAMFVSVFSGISIGFMVRYLSNKPWTARQVMYLAFPGELLKRMLRETVLPLGVSSVVAAMGSMELSLSLRVLRRALVYALLAKLSALVSALLVALTVQPGRTTVPEPIPPRARLYEPLNNGTADMIYDVIRGIFPENIVEASMHTDAITAMSFPNTTGVHGEGPSRIVNDSAGILLFCALLGAVLSGNEGGVLLGFFIGLSNAMMLIAHLVLIYSPFGVFFLTVAYIVDIEDLSRLLSHMGRYLFTVMAGLALHAVIILPLLFVAATRRSYRALLSNVALPLVVAFSTTSGMATVPATIAVLEERLRLEPRIVRLLVPVAAVVVVEGTSIYVTISAMFFAQMDVPSMNVLTVLVTCVLSMLCSMATPSVGGPGYLRLYLIRKTMGLPTDNVGLLFLTDWIVDRFAAAVNVLTGVVGIEIVQEYSANDLIIRDTAQLPRPGAQAAGPPSP
ncbi:excitatory amino acid transporter 3-like isoform X2 [Haemaphysalis longicornis]